MTRRSCAILWAVFALLFSGSLAAVIQQASGRFDPLVIQDPSSRLGIVAEDPTRTPGLDALGAGWNAFRQSHGADWRIWLDRRSGSPTLVEGPTPSVNPSAVAHHRARCPAGAIADRNSSQAS